MFLFPSAVISLPAPAPIEEEAGGHGVMSCVYHTPSEVRGQAVTSGFGLSQSDAAFLCSVITGPGKKRSHADREYQAPV